MINKEEEYIILKEVEKTTKKDFSNIQELLNWLTDQFEEKLKKVDRANGSYDSQDAFNELNKEMSGMLDKYFSYTLGTEKWKIEYVGEEKDIDTIIEYWNDGFIGAEAKTLKNVINGLYDETINSMSFSQCDYVTALKTICDDLFTGIKDTFKVNYGKYQPRIQLKN